MSARHRAPEITDDTGAADVAISVLSGDPSPAELAAITAVLTAVAQEVAEAEARSDARRTGRWERGPRRLRGPITAGPGAWNGFQG